VAGVAAVRRVLVRSRKFRDLNWSTSIVERRLPRKLLGMRGKQLRQVAIPTFFSRILDRRADLGVPTSSPFSSSKLRNVFANKKNRIAWVAKSCLHSSEILISFPFARVPIYNKIVSGPSEKISRRYVTYI